jgi:hypothetical protein
MKGDHRLFCKQSHQTNRKRCLVPKVIINLMFRKVLCELLGVRNLANRDLPEHISHRSGYFFSIHVRILIAVMSDDVIEDRALPVQDNSWAFWMVGTTVSALSMTLGGAKSLIRFTRPRRCCASPVKVIPSSRLALTSSFDALMMKSA